MASLIPGYFLEDFVDMLCNQKLHQSWELLFHHSVVSLPVAPEGQTLAFVPPGGLGDRSRAPATASVGVCCLLQNV